MQITVMTLTRKYANKSDDINTDNYAVMTLAQIIMQITVMTLTQIIMQITVMTLTQIIMQIMILTR